MPVTEQGPGPAVGAAPATGGAPVPREEVLVFGEQALARLALLPVDAADPDQLLARIGARERNRAGTLKSAQRYREYVLSRWLLARFEGPPPDRRSISHCHRWIAVGRAEQGRIGLDVESRRPRALAAVAERLGWGERSPRAQIQAWTLWEAWRKLEGGSVLDAPDATYGAALAIADGLFEAPREVAGVTWWSLDLGDAVLSLAHRP